MISWLTFKETYCPLIVELVQTETEPKDAAVFSTEWIINF